jgi:hypothetical protein
MSDPLRHAVERLTRPVIVDAPDRLTAIEAQTVRVFHRLAGRDRPAMGGPEHPQRPTLQPAIAGRGASWPTLQITRIGHFDKPVCGAGRLSPRRHDRRRQSRCRRPECGKSVFYWFCAAAALLASAWGHLGLARDVDREPLDRRQEVKPARQMSLSAPHLDSERTAPVKANQRLTVANPRPRRHWAAKVISATGKPGRGRGQLCISCADAL